jgi:uncharacterized protein YecE (DUF72 family)
VDGDHVVAATPDGDARDVFLFFDNTDKRHAPGNARGLMRRLGQKVPARRRASEALSLPYRDRRA